MKEQPFISIILPTYNRASMLPETLDSFLEQTYPAGLYEMIIVNNNSTDETAQVIERYCALHKNVRSLFEPRQGAHYARNSGAKAAKGDLLYFTDDDMLADRNLLINIIQGFRQDERVGAVTGRILPKWEIEPPQWVIELCYNGWMGINDLGENTIVASDKIIMYSGHEAILPEVFWASGGFNPDMLDGVSVGDNETGLDIKIKSLGYTLAYVGSSLSYHRIPKERLTQKYLNKRLANQGNCDSYTDYRIGVFPRRVLLRRILYYFRQMGNRTFRYITHRMHKNNEWRMHRAYIHYYLRRIRYDYKLILDENWRQFVLKSDWINE